MSIYHESELEFIIRMFFSAAIFNLFFLRAHFLRVLVLLRQREGVFVVWLSLNGNLRCVRREKLITVVRKTLMLTVGQGEVNFFLQ